MINYQICIPGGNKTALVLGLETDASRRKMIQDAIMQRHAHDIDGEVEQVGFISIDLEHPELIMTGGEFCGNATRAAAAYYLKEKNVQALSMRSSGCPYPLQTGYTQNGEVFAQMPLQHDSDAAMRELGDTGMFWVALEGISHLVVPVLQSENYLAQIKKAAQKKEKLNIAMDFLEGIVTEYQLNAGEAYGVMFLEETGEQLHMHPFVYVKTSGTCYYETACGSGTMCVGLVESFLSAWGNIKLSLVQPSGQMIAAVVEKKEQLTGKIVGSVAIGDMEKISLYN